MVSVGIHPDKDRFYRPEGRPTEGFDLSVFIRVHLWLNG